MNMARPPVARWGARAGEAVRGSGEPMPSEPHETGEGAEGEDEGDGGHGPVGSGPQAEVRVAHRNGNADEHHARPEHARRAHSRRAPSEEGRGIGHRDEDQRHAAGHLPVPGDHGAGDTEREKGKENTHESILNHHSRISRQTFAKNEGLD